ncbi:MAG: hypothetical protein H7328_06235 [Bdellovibrio sp.]|nr:hypothetical protein [Bdellovibrio sp.]
MTQRNITIMAMCAVVAGAVFVNEYIIKNVKSDQDRGVASFGERFEPNQIKWEQELAQSVSKDSKAKTLLGSKPNMQDRLLFEVFEGRYEAKLDQGKIQKISLLQNQAPIQLKTDDFMKDYGALLKSYDSYSKSQVDAAHEDIQLKAKDGSAVGVMKIERDDKGRVLNIEIQ